MIWTTFVLLGCVLGAERHSPHTHDALPLAYDMNLVIRSHASLFVCPNPGFKDLSCALLLNVFDETCFNLQNFMIDLLSVKFIISQIMYL